MNEEIVIGIDLGTSSVKLIAVDHLGKVLTSVSNNYPIYHIKAGYSEQDPKDWVLQTIDGLAKIRQMLPNAQLKGISFSGQMHGLVIIDENKTVLRKAILWNDTRTTKQCQYIYDSLGEKRLLEITHNKALEGFTLPKILWVQQNEAELFEKMRYFMLPKDYLRYRLTGHIATEYSDASGTLLLDMNNLEWSKEICEHFNIPSHTYPPLISSHDIVGNLLPEICEETGWNTASVIAGGADNACGALGAGIIDAHKGMVSIGTSGVVLMVDSRDHQNTSEWDGKLHHFSHVLPDVSYQMGVTLAAGHSLSWFKDKFYADVEFVEMMQEIERVEKGANGLLFSPYISGERTPYADSSIRGTFTGIDASHQKAHFGRSVLEGITFSLRDCLALFEGKSDIPNSFLSIGGGAKSENWLQLQASVFNVQMERLTVEEGPALGAAILAAVGIGWFNSFQECVDQFIEVKDSKKPLNSEVDFYQELYNLYRIVYGQTVGLHEELLKFRV